MGVVNSCIGSPEDTRAVIAIDQIVIIAIDHAVGREDVIVATLTTTVVVIGTTVSMFVLVNVTTVNAFGFSHT